VVLRKDPDAQLGIDADDAHLRFHLSLQQINQRRLMRNIDHIQIIIDLDINMHKHIERIVHENHHQ
jgi:hypothetical protein